MTVFCECMHVYIKIKREENPVGEHGVILSTISKCKVKVCYIQHVI